MNASAAPCPRWQALAEAFPEVPPELVATALQRHNGDLDAAAAALLHQGRSVRPSAKPLPKNKHKPSWGALTTKTTGAQQRLPVAPRFKSASRQDNSDLPLSCHDFPEGLAANGASAMQAPARHAQQAANAQRQRAEVVLPRAQQQQQQPWPRPQMQQKAMPSIAADALLERHGWAGQELVAAVLAAMQGDAAAADVALADMVAPDGQGDSLQGPAVQQTQHAQHHEVGGPKGTLGFSEAQQEEDEWEGAAEEQADAYYRHRHVALRLGRQWQRAVRGAAAAFAASCHGEARQLAAQAQRLRVEALAAHAEAAERIEEENNRGRGPFELDLHGLHSQEAVAALQRRLDLLHTLLADPAAAAAAARMLRVVVGRGVHSSGGEASVPRVVESHLRGAGLRFHSRGGAVDVQLRAGAGVSSAAVGGAVG